MSAILPTSEEANTIAFLAQALGFVMRAILPAIKEAGAIAILAQAPGRNLLLL